MAGARGKSSDHDAGRSSVEPLSAADRARGRRLAIVSHPAGNAFAIALTEHLPTIALLALGAGEGIVGGQSAVKMGANLLQLPTLLSTTLELLSRDSRWSSNEEIKITIATHPRVTFPVADRLVKTLSLLGIRKVIRRPGLNPAIKDMLVQRIPHKQLQGW